MIMGDTFESAVALLWVVIVVLMVMTLGDVVLDTPWNSIKTNHPITPTITTTITNQGDTLRSYVYKLD